MADVLLQTLYPSGSPTVTFNTYGPGGRHTECTAAQLHDSSDSTSCMLESDSDGVDAASGDCAWDWAHDSYSAAGVISFVRLVLRTKHLGTLGVAENTARVNGVTRGAAAADPASYTVRNIDFATDPADSQPWDSDGTKINAQTFGWFFANETLDENHSIQSMASEFKIEVWGVSAQISTPAAVNMSLGVPGATSGIGGVSSSPAAVNLTLATPAVTSLIGGVRSAPAAVNLALGVPAVTMAEGRIIGPAVVHSHAPGFGIAAGTARAEAGRTIESSVEDTGTGPPTSEQRNKGVRSRGRPYFAMWMRGGLPPSFASGDDCSLKATIAIHSAPVRRSAPDEPHWLASFHVPSLGVEIFSIGVTPDLRVCAATRNKPILYSGPGVVSADGQFHEYELFSPHTPRSLLLDGNVVAWDDDGINMDRPQGTIADPVRVMAFNGVAALTRCECSIARISIDAEEGDEWWDFNEGNGIVVPGFLGSGFTSDVAGLALALVAGWYDPRPLFTLPYGAPPDGDLGSAFLWHLRTKFTRATVVRPTYRRSTGSGGSYTPFGSPHS